MSDSTDGEMCLGMKGKAECIYKETCSLYLMNMTDEQIDAGPEWIRCIEPDLKKWTCYVPLDGRRM